MGSGVQFDILVDNTQRVSDQLQSGLKRALTKIGMQAVRHAKENITRVGAVDTGRLRNSITSKVVDDTVYIGSDVEYAAYVECGTGRQSTVGGNPLLKGMRARPYLVPAATEHADEYREILKSEVNKQ